MVAELAPGPAGAHVWFLRGPERWEEGREGEIDGAVLGAVGAAEPVPARAEAPMSEAEFTALSTPPLTEREQRLLAEVRRLRALVALPAPPAPAQPATASTS